MKSPDRIEPVVLLLFTGMLVFTVVVMACEKFYPMDGQLFQVFAGLLTGFSGAFFMRVKPKNSDSADTTPTHTTTTVNQDAKTLVQETQVGGPAALLNDKPKE
jgi:hypothetical protein